MTSIVRTTEAMQCVHCRYLVELNAFSLRCPEGMLIAREAFRLEHIGCVQYGIDHAAARRHRRFVINMRRAMRKPAA